MKRIISMLLATTMLTTNITSVLAGEVTSEFDVTITSSSKLTTEDENVISKVSATEIMTGTKVGFEPAKTLTRAEAAAIMVRMKGISESSVKAASGETSFVDVESDYWATGYINIASSLGIIRGDKKGNFMPSKEVTVAEFTTMAVRSLGAGTLVDSMGTWPTNYVNFANEEKLTNNVFKSYKADATRMDAAYIVANTLEAPIWVKNQVTNTSEVTYEKEEDKNILNTVLDINVEESLILKKVDMKDREITTEKSAVNRCEVVESINLAAFKAGTEVDVWYNDDKEIIRLVNAEDSKQEQIEFTEIVEVKDDEITLMVDGEEEEFEITKNTEFTYNGSDLKKYKEDSLEESEEIFGRIIVNGDEVEYIYAEEYTEKGIIEEIKNDTIYFENGVIGSTDPANIDLDDRDLSFAIIKDGMEIDAEDLEEGDALFFYSVNDKDEDYNILVLTDDVEGEITSITTTKTKISIDGDRYEVTSDVKVPNLGTEVVAYLNEAGKISMMEKTKNGVNGDIAVVTSIRTVNNKYGEVAIEIELEDLEGLKLDAKEMDLDDSLEELCENITAENAKILLEVISGKTLTLDGTKIKSGEVVVATFADEKIELTNKFAVDYTKSILGKAVKFDVDSSKYVLTEVANGDNIISQSEKDYQMKVKTDDYNKDSRKFGSYRLSDDTIIVVVDKKDSDKAYETSIKVIDIDSLGDNKNITAFVDGIDEDTNRIETLIITSDVTRKTDNNFAVVTELAKVSTEDYEYEVELLLNNGDTETYYVDEEVDADSLVKGTLVDVVVEDDVVVEVNDSKVTVKEGFIISINNSTIKFREYGKDTDVIDIAEDLIYFTVDEDENYDEGKESQIDTISSSDSKSEYKKLYKKDKATLVKLYIAEKTDVDNDTEIVAVLYGDTNTELELPTEEDDTTETTVNQSSDGEIVRE